MGHPVQHRFMSLALEVCIGAALSGVCGPTFLVSWRCLLRAPEHKWRRSCNSGEGGKRLLEKEGKGRRARKLRLPLLAMIIAHTCALKSTTCRTLPCCLPFVILSTHPFFSSNLPDRLLKISKYALSAAISVLPAPAVFGAVQAHLIVPFGEEGTRA